MEKYNMFQTTNQWNDVWAKKHPIYAVGFDPSPESKLPAMLNSQDVHL